MNQLRWPHAGILRHKRRGRRGNPSAPAVNQGLCAAQIVAHLLRFAGTSQCAIATHDAEFRNNLGAIVLYSNGLHWAFADTFVAILALVFPGFDEAKSFHVRPAMVCLVAAEVRATLPL